MSGHTPGPWEAMLQYGGTRLINEDTGTTFSIVKPVSGDFPEDTICEVWGQEHDDSANARLIAAAPDLLEALRELLRLNDPAGLTPEIVKDNRRFREFMTAIDEQIVNACGKARAAIAKAEGK